MIAAEDYFVRIVELPASVRGVTVPNDDGTFSIYINALYADEAQRRTLRHELEHIARDHFYKAEPLERQEAEAEGKAPPPPGQAGEAAGVRCYHSLRSLEDYLRSIDALSPTVEELAAPDEKM